MNERVLGHDESGSSSVRNGTGSLLTCRIGAGIDVVEGSGLRMW